MIAELFALKRPRKPALDAGLALSNPDRNGARGGDTNSALLPEELFRKMLSIERKRMERSSERFILMLVQINKVLDAEGGKITLNGITKALYASTRETDLQGWYKHGTAIGVIWTEIGTGDLNSILSILQSKVGAAFRNRLEPEQISVIPVSFHVFPDDLALEKGGRSADISLCPDVLPVWSGNPSGHMVPGFSTSVAS
jgi:hypothetical protein